MATLKDVPPKELFQSKAHHLPPTFRPIRRFHDWSQAAIKIDRAAERCVDCLLELIKTKARTRPSLFRRRRPPTRAEGFRRPRVEVLMTQHIHGQSMDIHWCLGVRTC